MTSKPCQNRKQTRKKQKSNPPSPFLNRFRPINPPTRQTRYIAPFSSTYAHRILLVHAVFQDHGALFPRRDRPRNRKLSGAYKFLHFGERGMPTHAYKLIYILDSLASLRIIHHVPQDPSPFRPLMVLGSGVPIRVLRTPGFGRGNVRRCRTGFRVEITRNVRKI